MTKPIILFDDYDKISDDVLYLGSKTYLRMNVLLSNKFDKDNVPRRESFHKEFRYDSKYSNRKLITIRRSFSYHLSIDKTDSRVSINIRPQDIILLRSKLKMVSSWFDDGTFGSKNNQLIVYKQRQPIVIQGLLFNNYIQFDPVAIIWEQTGSQEPGVRMTLSDPNEFIDIPVDKFFGLMYVIQTINMYESAQLLINYIQRPEYGTNMYEFEESNFLRDQPERDMVGVDNRQIPTQKKSFFDKIDEM